MAENQLGKIKLNKMRVVILTNKDLTSSLVFERICKNNAFQIAGVAFSSTLTSKKSFWTGFSEIFKKTGKRYFFYLCFYNGIFRVKEIICGSLPFLNKNFFSLRNYAKKQKIKYLDCSDFNSKYFLLILKEWNPDIIVTRINQILKEDVLNSAEYGCLCCHSSFLPKYRGIAAEFHSLLNGEETVGFSVMKMTDELDRGDILFQEKIKITPADTVFSLTQKTSLLGADLLEKSLLAIRNNGASYFKGLGEGSYYSWPNPKEVMKFKKNRKKIISFKETLKYIFGV